MDWEPERVETELCWFMEPRLEQLPFGMSVSSLGVVLHRELRKFEGTWRIPAAMNIHVLKRPELATALERGETIKSMVRLLTHDRDPAHLQIVQSQCSGIPHIN